MEAAERAASSLRLRSWSLRSRTLGPHRRLRGTSACLRLSMPLAEFSFGSRSRDRPLYGYQCLSRSSASARCREEGLSATDVLSALSCGSAVAAQRIGEECQGRTFQIPITARSLGWTAPSAQDAGLRIVARTCSGVDKARVVENPSNLNWQLSCPSLRRSYTARENLQI